jgi:predicted Zn-dependent peptidase
MGTLIPPKTSVDYFPLEVLNQVLGGTYISRLLMNLRESRGYAYSAFSYMEFYRYCGVFYVHARITPEFIRSSVDEIQKEIRIISTQRVPNEEIETAKSYLMGRYPLNIQTYADLSARIADVQVLGLSAGHWDKYYQNIMRIDSRSVYETAQRHSLVTPIIIIVGDESVLETIGFEKIDLYNSKGELVQSIMKGGQQ